MVSAGNALNSSANITLNGTSVTLPSLQFTGSYNGSIASLTLSGNSSIDLGTGNVVLDLGIIKGLQTYSLKIYNWSGNTLWSGGYGGGTDQIYTSGNKSLTSSELANISFYTSSFSQGLTSGFTGSGFQNSINGEIFGVPEPSTYVLGFLLLGGMGVYYLRKKLTRSRKAAKEETTSVSVVNRLGGADSILPQI